jgi:hypothetical protein
MWLGFALLFAVSLGVQASARAQGNLLDFGNWTYQGFVAGTPVEGLQTILGSNSAEFEGFGWYPYYFSTEIFNGTIATQPGASYEISLTMAYGGADYSGWGVGMSFDDFSVEIGGIPQYQYGLFSFTNNCDFIVTATSPTTPMSFTFSLWLADVVTLSNVSVMQTPEVSTSRLLVFGGCALPFLRQGWRFFQKRKRN